MNLNPTSGKGKHCQGTSVPEGELKKSFVRVKVSIIGKLATFHGTQKNSKRKKIT